MPLFFFPPDQPVVVRQLTNNGAGFPVMTYVYVSTDDSWRIRDPKSGTWIDYDTLGVPEIYRAQVLLLVAAYPD